MVINKASLLQKFLLTLVAALCALISYFEFEHRYNYGHFFSYGLHVDAISEYGDIGIPGQTHLYRARLSNFSLLPLSFTACDYVTDAMEHGTEFPYAVQRWDASSNSWQTIVEVSEKGFCHPAPLSTIETHIVSKQLWFGMSVEVMEGEATGARVPFQKGDMARFVVFKRVGEKVDWWGAIPSLPFYIEDDVIRNENASFRVQH